MPDSSTTRCPECGAVNGPHARSYTQCGAPLVANWQSRPHLRNKVLRRTDFMAAARANQRSTRRLVFALLVILGVLGYLIGWSMQLVSQGPPGAAQSVWFVSRWGLLGALGLFSIGALWSWIAFRSGDRIVLRLTGAREVTPDDEPVLHNVVEEMAIAAGIVRPRVYVIETEALNAFATGMSPARSAIGVTRGLLETLNREELQGVVGHEMGHIVNWDIRYATAVGVIVGSLLARRLIAAS